MKLTIKYFGLLADLTSKSEEEIAFDESPNTIEHVIKMIESKYANLQNTNYSIALNQVMINNNSPIKNNDTLALLPPFAGG